MNRNAITLLLLGLFSFHAAADTTELPLKAGDRVSINIGGIQASDIDQVRGVYTVSERGTINLLHIKQIKASGIKPSELQEVIEQKYIAEGIYTNPTVTVAPEESKRQVHVISGCKQNGPVIYTPSMTIMTAISGAKGFSDFAKRHKTRLIRNGKTIILDLSKADPEKDVKLEPDDQIIVPE